MSCLSSSLCHLMASANCLASNVLPPVDKLRKSLTAIVASGCVKSLLSHCFMRHNKIIPIYNSGALVVRMEQTKQQFSMTRQIFYVAHHDKMLNCFFSVYIPITRHSHTEITCTWAAALPWLCLPDHVRHTSHNYIISQCGDG